MESEIVQKAREFALKVHGKQSYSTSFPYLTHLEMVVDTLKQFGYTDDVMLSSAYLHDTIEDTQTSYQDIKKEFGEEIAEIVYCVTDELGRNRQERHIKTYPKIKSNTKAIILKLADRISNVSFSIKGGDKMDMYRKEHAGFRKALYSSENKEMWEKLDSLFEGL